MEKPTGMFEGDLTAPVSDQDKEKATGWLNMNKGGWEKQLDAFLLTRTFLVEDSVLSRADIVVYVVVHEFVSKMKAFGNAPNFVRWFDFVQHQEPATTFKLSMVVIPRVAPAFLTAPPAPSKGGPDPAVKKKDVQKEEVEKEVKKEEVKKEALQKGKEQQKGGKQQQKGGQQQKQQNGGNKQAAPPPGSDFSRLSIVVGQIVSAKKHPDADSLYFEQIDLGEEKPRDVVSGLVKHITLDEFVNKKVLVLTNLKPAKMRGILSSGMVLCASTDDSLEVLSAPEGAKIGERLMVEGEDGPADGTLPPKKKIWDKVRDSGDFTVAENGQIVYKGKPLTSATGDPVTSAKKLVGAKIA